MVKVSTPISDESTPPVAAAQPVIDEEVGGAGPAHQAQQVSQAEVRQLTRSERYYSVIPDIVAIIELDYEKSAVFCKRAMWLAASGAIFEVILGVLTYDSSDVGLFFFLLFLAAFLARRAWMARLSYKLYANRAIHLAITRQGIRQDLGRSIASRSRVTIIHPFSDMRDVSIGGAPFYQACLAPLGLDIMKIQLPKRWWFPFKVIGVKNGSKVEQLVREKIRAATPIEAVAVSPAYSDDNKC